MQLYFIRHGQSANNALWAATGSAENRSEDPGLTERGRKQAECVAEHLAGGGGSQTHGANFHGFHLTHLYSSLMLRAVETGAVIAERVGLPLRGWIDLHECGGIYLDDPGSGRRMGRPGQPRGRLAARFPSLVMPETATERGWWNRPFEREEDRRRRAARVADELLGRHARTDDRVGVITHGEFYSRLLEWLLGVRQDGLFWFTLNNAGITRVDITPEHMNVVYQNRIAFLPRELVT